MQAFYWVGSVPSIEHTFYEVSKIYASIGFEVLQELYTSLTGLLWKRVLTSKDTINFPVNWKTWMNFLKIVQYCFCKFKDSLSNCLAVWCVGDISLNRLRTLINSSWLCQWTSHTLNISYILKSGYFATSQDSWINTILRPPVLITLWRFNLQLLFA